jgi:hypothetical protein
MRVFSAIAAVLSQKRIVDFCEFYPARQSSRIESLPDGSGLFSGLEQVLDGRNRSGGLKSSGRTNIERG